MQTIAKQWGGHAWVKRKGVLLPIGGLVQKPTWHHLLPCVRAKAIIGQQHTQTRIVAEGGTKAATGSHHTKAVLQPQGFTFSAHGLPQVLTCVSGQILLHHSLKNQR